MNERDHNPSAPEAEVPDGAEAPERTEEGTTPAAGAQEQHSGVEAEAEPTLSDDPDAEAQTEVEILRGELSKLQEELEAARQEAETQRDKALRARADLENVRKRASFDQERAREQGIDAAVTPVLTVYDDLRRALEASEGSDDPSSIVQGVRAVLEGLERNLGRLEIERVGHEGEAFDPDRHEALTSMPSSEPEQAGTIAQVFEAGFVRGERLVRPARVVVFEEDDPEGDDDEGGAPADADASRA